MGHNSAHRESKLKKIEIKSSNMTLNDFEGRVLMLLENCEWSCFKRQRDPDPILHNAYLLKVQYIYEYKSNQWKRVRLGLEKSK